MDPRIALLALLGWQLYKFGSGKRPKRPILLGNRCDPNQPNLRWGIVQWVSGPVSQTRGKYAVNKNALPETEIWFDPEVLDRLIEVARRESPS